MGLIVFPLATIVLFISSIGIPFALIGTAIFAVAFYLTQILVAYWLGEKIIKNSPTRGFALDLLVINIINLLPIIGRVIRFLVILAGFGGLILTHSQIHKNACEKEII